MQILILPIPDQLQNPNKISQHLICITFVSEQTLPI
ncbi:hypothetical protein L345_06269 [Ophiophagus hannah]|uniref:Uncharacterized protein n=1 Tax=Ophiophagus hannah TaxID=8665 RepID=V8P0S8_OPHHA|nr:hypothetical protein L345_06269 [Ophiophagus hannah]